MALIVEDGTGLSDSESLCSVAHADNYHSLRGNTLWATMSTNEKEQALRRGTQGMLLRFRGRIKGYRLKTTQAQDWPRYGVFIDDFTYVATDIVPVDVQNACAEMAFRAAGGELYPDKSQGVVSEQVDVIKVEYDKNSQRQVIFEMVDRMLGVYMTGMSGVNVRLVRT
jgi:hypothetical protein